MLHHTSPSIDDFSTGKQDKLTSVSLFTGAGGLDLGMESTGFSTQLCVEIDSTCHQTLRHNRPEWKIASPGDILTLHPQDLLEQANTQRGEVDLLAGGPPCQPFSKSGYWARGDSKRLNDPRAKTITAYMDILATLLPRVILLENVKGLAFGGKDEAWKYLQSRFSDINACHGTAYSPQIIHVNSVDYGVPQSRERIFVIASRSGKQFQLPHPTHAKIPRREQGLLPYTTAWDAIGDLDTDEWSEDLQLTGKWAELLPSIPEGENYLWHTPRGGGNPLFGWRTRYWSFLLKLAKNKPSWTIQASPGPATGPFHWKDRKLSIRELCRLQTFPDSYVVQGDYRSALRQIGNAVPPLIANMLGNEIKKQLLGKPANSFQNFLITAREGCPPPSRPAPMSHKYDNLIGNHIDHPGTGKGPGALKR